MSIRPALRTVWLSDIHLGSRACRVTLLLEYLDQLSCETLYLVGDIVDIESLRRSFYWPTNHGTALRALLDKARNGTRVVYIPGNHDHDCRAFVGLQSGQLEILERTIHTTADGRRLLVLHGDEFDSAIKCGPLLAAVGSLSYHALIFVNRAFNRLRRMAGLPYWSLANHIKSRIDSAVRYVDNFERASVRAAQEARVDGVVCGHIHRAALMRRDGILYCNDGDWVESCTALAEDWQGQLALQRWAAQEPTAISAAVSLRDAA